jgi:hypothetical protein
MLIYCFSWWWHINNLAIIGNWFLPCKHSEIDPVEKFKPLEGKIPFKGSDNWSVETNLTIDRHRGMKAHTII